MLQRLLGEFLNVNGVDQAMMMDDRGSLLSSVGGEGQTPPRNVRLNLTVAALDAVQHHDQGDLHEVWVEGKASTCIDIITPYRILMLSVEPATSPAGGIPWTTFASNWQQRKNCR